MLFLAYTNHRFEVESMKASLLGCGEVKEFGRGEGKMGTVEERCLYEYNLTLSFEETMGRWVWTGQAVGKDAL